jgi:hypothetical protein
MKQRLTLIYVCAATLAVCMSGCTERDRSSASATNGAGFANVRKTGFPGMVAAGGGTSGEVLARAQRATDATYAGGTPGIAGGSGGNTGGAATGGSVQETGQGPSSGVTPPAGAKTPAAKPGGTGQ